MNRSVSICKQTTYCHVLSFLLLLLVFTACFAGCTKNTAPYTKTGFYFDTVISITVYSPKDRDALEQCFALASHYEALLSRTREGSDIYRINHSGGAPVTVDPDTAYVLQKALQYAALTDGRIDPTIGAVSELWNFHESETPALPDPAMLREALAHVDYTKLLVENTTVTLSDPDAVIDLGFIAKGFIADKMKEALKARGVESALINLGGNVLTLGSKPDHTAFTIGVRDPFQEEGSYLTTLSVTDQSVVSSGIYERCFVINGKNYHHILDPDTGYPVENDLAGVTILSDSSLEGDALSTTCMVLGYDEASSLIHSLDQAEAVFVTTDGEIHTTF